jgi:hypothetical protein
MNLVPRKKALGPGASNYVSLFKFSHQEVSQETTVKTYIFESDVSLKVIRCINTLSR